MSVIRKYRTPKNSAELGRVIEFMLRDTFPEVCVSASHGDDATDLEVDFHSDMRPIRVTFQEYRPEPSR